jgi:ABC-type multidrug transport system fused ATPase/permease subunit
MEEGRVVERGTHEELMEKRGSYHEMVLRQMHVSAENVEDSWA